MNRETESQTAESQETTDGAPIALEESPQEAQPTQETAEPSTTETNTETTPPPETAEETSVEETSVEDVDDRFITPDYAEILDEYTNDDEEPADATEPPPEPVPEVEEVAEAPVEEPEVQEEPVAEEQEVVAEPVEPVAEAEPPTPEEQQEQINQALEPVIASLEEKYTLTEEEQEQFAAEPEKVLASMAARLATDIHLSAYNSIRQMMPQMLREAMTGMQKEQQYEEQFYTRWSPLRNPQYTELVQKAIKSYQTVNPKATTDEVIKKAGMLAMIEAGLPVDIEKAMPMQTTKPQAVAPEPPAPRPHSPINPGSIGSAPAVTEEEDNIFARMALDFSRDA